MNQNEQDPGQKQTRGLLMAIVCAYVVYLGISLINGALKGGDGTPVWLSVVFGIAFIGIGGWFLVQYIRSAIRAGSRNSQTDEIKEETEHSEIETNDET